MVSHGIHRLGAISAKSVQVFAEDGVSTLVAHSKLTLVFASAALVDTAVRSFVCHSRRVLVFTFMSVADYIAISSNFTR